MSQAALIEIALETILSTEGVLITISCGSQSVEVQAILGQLSIAQFDNKSRRFRTGYQEFVCLTSSLKWNPELPFRPDKTFVVTRIDSDAGVTRVYSVVSPGGDEDASRPMDPYRIGWRIHTLLKSETPIES